jgi:uncharacterized protein YbaR (Trm112 family)
MSTPETETQTPQALDPNAIDPRLLEVLVCPQTRGPLIWDRERGELISRSARLAYPVRNGIPIMLVEEARDLDLPAPAAPEVPA